MATATAPKAREVAKLEDEATEPAAEEPKAKKTKAEKPEPKQPQALGGLKDTYVKEIRDNSKKYLDLITKEMEGVEPGHPYYSELKFAKIRAERVIFSMDELAKGKPTR